ncbi:hypothetical protein CF327_g3721 [Tilletia walkeri]|nr:hypothetical protein CF327_g3721 [Tilletia walkeri]
MTSRPSTPPDDAGDGDVSARAAEDAAVIARIAMANTSAVDAAPKTPKTKATTRTDSTSGTVSAKKNAENAAKGKGKKGVATPTPKAKPAETGKRGGARWKKDEDDVLLSKLSEIKANLGLTGANFKGTHYTQAAAEVNGKLKLKDAAARTGKQAQTRWKTIKENFVPFRRVVNRSGFSWDYFKCKISASEDMWASLIKDDKATAALRDKTFEYFEEVNKLVDGGVATGDLALDAGAGDDEEEEKFKQKPKHNKKSKYDSDDGVPLDPDWIASDLEGGDEDEDEADRDEEAEEEEESSSDDDVEQVVPVLI